jgi:enhancing lycopene biosynthesis protein 2
LQSNRYRKFGGRAKKNTKVAVVLSGCGVYDGSEITEAVSVLVKCSQAGAEVQCFAPDRDQMHVVDHNTGSVRGYAPRSVLQESARIARGDILALSKLKADDYSAVIFPGGFGAAKNLR